VNQVNHFEGIDFSKPLKIDKSLEGLAFDHGVDIAYLPQQLQSLRLIDKENTLNKKRLVQINKDKPVRKQFSLLENISYYTFTAISIYYDGVEAFPLYRGHQRYEHLSTDILMSSAIQAGDYLIRAVEPNGHFIYDYFPYSDRASDQYNMLRHAGTIYAMVELYEQTDNKALLNAAKKAIQYLIRQIQHFTKNEVAMACVVEDGCAKLGGNGLAILALVKYMKVTESREHLPIVRKLALWIQTTQKD